ncbi:hypothetical protein BM221_002001 [Beauveria bassiana]|uniref:Uncharacterized protein n=1 Tax=Beauveria bassiana TaxID=176275 RepID=A0A2N6NXB0_BEABA|nr:hypothetical protein BM221_002001 [Beauveria bassiana]
MSFQFWIDESVSGYLDSVIVEILRSVADFFAIKQTRAVCAPVIVQGCWEAGMNGQRGEETPLGVAS